MLAQYRSAKGLSQTVERLTSSQAHPVCVNSPQLHFRNERLQTLEQFTTLKPMTDER